MNPKYILPCLLIWTIDFTTTVYAIEFTDLVEGNQIQAFFQSFGWIFAFVIGIISVSLFFIFTLKLIDKFDLKHKNYLKTKLYVIPIATFCILETFTIINNINLIWKAF